MTQIENTAANSRKRWDEEMLARYLATSETWSGRQGYLAWVREWKCALNLCIAEVRKQRGKMRLPQQEIEDEDRSVAQSLRYRARIQCFNLLLVRAACKRRAAEERMQRIADEAAAEPDFK